MRLITFIAGLTIGLVSLVATELYRDIKDYQRGWFHE